ncbi:hypothetical protein [Caldilinea sp.]|uniref:hypothetical protein n=1 Tax=Caldilinea sp. TaxID=2293560 RepID=UPI002BB34B97|nr:hypothetical protein [Anaerolineales bacterium]HQY92825.1 hypothetical protein [Caldilinea sp.]
MINVDGEKVWAPTCKQELIAGLKRMGIHKVAGLSLERLSKKELTTAYCRERSRIVRRQQQERNSLRSLSCELPAIQAEAQLKLFASD